MTTTDSQQSFTSETSECLVLREVPKDYLLDLVKDRVNTKHENAYPEWCTDKDSCMAIITGLLKTSFIKASQEKNISFSRGGRDVPCTSYLCITKAWKKNPGRKDDFAYICRGHFSKNWELAMDKEVMNKLCVKYANPEEVPKKCCFSRLCVKRRTEMIKNWNNTGSRTHGKKCHVTRPHIEVEADQKPFRRKEGEYFFSGQTTKSPVEMNADLIALRRLVVSIYVCYLFYI